MKRRFLRFAGLTPALVSCLFAHLAFADTIITVTNSADAGPGTLRQAIADSAPGDTITFAITDTNTIALTTGQLLITNNLTIVSSNAPIAIDAAGTSRALEISASNTVLLDSLIITNGNALDLGGGILVDSGANVTLTNCTVAGNLAAAGGGIFISSNSIVTGNNCVFSGNSAANDGGAIDNEISSLLSLTGSFLTVNSAHRGGAIFSDLGTNALSHCTLSSNSAASGAILNTNGATIALSDSTLSSNSCPADWAGGINNWGTIAVNNCTISGNLGGGFLNTGGNAACNNSTFSGNTAVFDGGGYYTFSGSDTLNNCTISGNFANRRAGGLYVDVSSFIVLTNTILAGNSAVLDNPNVRGEFFGAHNLLDVDPLLAPLGNYGGPTQTMPPLSGSPAINAGTDSVTNLFATDQRGYPRLAGRHVDIGAVEVQPLIVLNTDDDGPGSLRATIASTPALVAFTNTLSGQTIHLTNGQITISNSVDIDASGLAQSVTIDAGGASRVLEIAASNTVSLDSLTITNGNTADNGGGILMDDGVTLALANCTVAGNSAAAGGGIAQLSGTLTVNNSTVFGNTATQSGGGFDFAGGQSDLNNCTLSGNTAGDANGGGIAAGAGATNTLNNCTITGNSAGAGGGIYLDPDSVATLVNTIVAGNTSTNASDIFGPYTGFNNLTNGNPLLAPLGNYGGPTLTMLPQAGSPALDAGLDTAAMLATDQRGFPRVSGAHVDIGAVEAQMPPANRRPVLQFSRAPGGVLNFAFTSISNGDFTILTSTNIARPANQWEILGIPTQTQPGSYHFVDAIGTNKARFYRVVSP